jgi:hypothetical protein
MSVHETVVAVVAASMAAHTTLSARPVQNFLPTAVLGALTTLTATGHLRPWEAFSGTPTLLAGVSAAQAIALAAVRAASGEQVGSAATASEAVPLPATHADTPFPVLR